MGFSSTRVWRLCLAAAAFTWTQALSPAHAASDFPTDAIAWIVAFSAGGGADRTARTMFPLGEEYMGVQVNVQNLPGAGGLVAWQEILSRPADGYTVMQGTSTPVVSLLLEADPPLQPNQIKIVCYLSSFPAIVAAQKDQPWSSWEGLEEYARENPGAVILGGTDSNLIGAVNVLAAAGLEVTLVPYHSTADVVADFIGGHLDMIAAEPPAIIDLVPDSAVAIYNSGSQRLPEDVDSRLGSPPLATADLGLEGFSFPRWVGVHPDTEDWKVQILSDKIGEILSDERVVSRLADQGLDIGFVPFEQAQAEYNKMVESMRQAVELIQ